MCRTVIENPRCVVTLATEEDELHLWTLLISAFHFQGWNGCFVGRSIRFFVVERTGNQLIGCASVGSSIINSQARDNWIGWNFEQRLRNLNRIANNWRFLLFPQVRAKNAGSQALSQLARLGAKAWKDRYGDDLVLLETYVEPPYKGTVYRASGWTFVGQTKGYGSPRVGMDRSKLPKKGKAFPYHGVRKSIFVRPLDPDWQRLLKA